MTPSAPKPYKKRKGKSNMADKRNRKNLAELDDFRKSKPIPRPQPSARKKENRREKRRQEREAQEFPGLVDMFSEKARSLTAGAGILKFVDRANPAEPSVHASNSNEGRSKSQPQTQTPTPETAKVPSSKLSSPKLSSPKLSSPSPNNEGESEGDNDTGFISLEGSDDDTELAKQFNEYEQQTTYTNQFACPWLTTSDAESKAGDGMGTDDSIGRQMGAEVLEFLRYVSPSPAEVRKRESCVSRLRNTVRQLWPDASVSVFGSYATGMYLPDADMDVVIQSNSMRANLRSEMFRLSARLKTQLAEQVQVISHARVPIIKYVESRSGLNVDIAFGQQGGIETAALVSTWLTNNKVLKPLAMVVRQFLKRRGLSDVANGGLGGYATICMVYSRLQQRLSEVEQDTLGNVGLLLLDFFDYYGHEFDNGSQIVRPQRAPDCFPISKRKNGSMATQKATGLAIEDPNDDENNISKASFNYVAVKRSFANAADYLKALCVEWQRLPKGQRPQLSFLAPLLKYSENQEPRRKASLSDALSVGLRPANVNEPTRVDARTPLKLSQRIQPRNTGATPNKPGTAKPGTSKPASKRTDHEASRQEVRPAEERGRGVQSYDPWQQIYAHSETEEGLLSDRGGASEEAGEGSSVNGTTRNGKKRRRGTKSSTSNATSNAASNTNSIKTELSTPAASGKVTGQNKGNDVKDEDDDDSRTKLTTAQRRQFWKSKAGTPEQAKPTEETRPTEEGS